MNPSPPGGLASSKTPRVRGIRQARGATCCVCGEMGGAQFIEKIKKHLHPHCAPAYAKQTSPGNPEQKVDP